MRMKALLAGFGVVLLVAVLGGCEDDPRDLDPGPSGIIDAGGGRGGGSGGSAAGSGGAGSGGAGSGGSAAGTGGAGSGGSAAGSGGGDEDAG
jgi:hypothetical protein